MGLGIFGTKHTQFKSILQNISDLLATQQQSQHIEEIPTMHVNSWLIYGFNSLRCKTIATTT